MSLTNLGLNDLGPKTVWCKDQVCKEGGRARLCHAQARWGLCELRKEGHGGEMLMCVHETTCHALGPEGSGHP